MTWSVFVSWDLPASPHYELLKISGRALNALLLERSPIRSAGSSPKLFVVFREEFDGQPSVPSVKYVKKTNTFTVDTTADSSVLAYGAEGLEALRKRILVECDRAIDYAVANGLQPIDARVRQDLANLVFN